MVGVSVRASISVNFTVSVRLSNHLSLRRLCYGHQRLVHSETSSAQCQEDRSSVVRHTSKPAQDSISQLQHPLGFTVVDPVNVVRDLGVFLDAKLSMRDHVTRTAQTCFYHLRRLWAVCRQLSHDVMAQLVSTFVLSQLDYCNVILIGLPASTLAPLWRALHAAARLVLDLRPCDHVTQALQELHWLPIMQRINYKLYLLVHKSRTGRAPVYVSDMLTPAANYTTAVVAVIMRSSQHTVNSSHSSHFVKVNSSHP